MKTSHQSNIKLASFKPAWWLPSPHLQTLWPVVFKKRHRLDIQVEKVELADGDFIDLCWSNRPSENTPAMSPEKTHDNTSNKTVLILHGLEGAITSHYANSIFHELEQAGYQPVFMYFRGCSGRINRLARAYHSGETGDLSTIVEHIKTKTDNYPYAVIGFSLGGNVLLKWLGETSHANPIKKAIAVSVPFKLYDAAIRLESGTSKIYREHLLKSLRATYRNKFKQIKSPLNVNVDMLKSFWSYDDKVTAPLHGFSGAQEYYDTCSSGQYLKDINVPTRIIHSYDDPFMYATTVPDKKTLNKNIDLIATKRGGHVGFISGSSPLSAYSWCDHKIIEFLNTKVSE